ncbi:MAG: putative peptidase M15 [Prokaryotic dsDNA virus sp.]|nr:MAG: putative peptidase M15 [Prokaryotic dsDNA virus sp.]|tara:strand:+ start:2883 stop:3287 length:405 start_codon:yes stop_codon:yes gene_type:complete
MKLRGAKYINYTTSSLDLIYFNVSEFDSPDEVGSGYRMQKDFLRRLDTARGIAGIPFKINSGYRTAAHNTKIGGRVGSSHKKGLAVDIAYKGSRERYLIINALMVVGVNRFGIGKTFIHADVDKNKDEDVIWLY